MRLSVTQGQRRVNGREVFMCCAVELVERVDRAVAFLQERGIERPAVRVVSADKERRLVLQTYAEGAFHWESDQEMQVRLEKEVQRQLSKDQPNLPRIRRFMKQKVYIFDSFQESELLNKNKIRKAVLGSLDTFVL